ncbi:MAG: hypothetical protein RH862_11655 [Leptospiraceae bacterium]
MYKKLTFLMLLSLAPIWLHCPEEQPKPEEVKITPENAEQEAEKLLEEIDRL